MPDFEKLKKKEPGLMNTAIANKHIDAIHGLANMTSSPEGLCKVVLNGRKAVLTFTGGALSDVIIVFNGTGYYCNLMGTITGEVT